MNNITSIIIKRTNSTLIGFKQFLNLFLFKQAPIASYNTIKKHSFSTVKTGLPKRPLSPYLEFAQNKLKDASKTPEPGLKQTERIKKIASEWKLLSEKEKEPYIKLFHKNAEEYKKNVGKFYKDMGKENAEKFKENSLTEKRERRVTLQKLRTKRAKKERGLPTKPGGAFFSFMKTLKQGEMPIQEFAKDAAQKWKALPEAEKQKYRDEAKKELDAYKKKLDAWDAEVIVSGHANLARKKTVKRLAQEEGIKIEKPKVRKAKVIRKVRKVASKRVVKKAITKGKAKARKPVKKLARKTTALKKSAKGRVKPAKKVTKKAKAPRKKAVKAKNQ